MLLQRDCVEMEYAREVADGRVWEALEFSRLPELDIETKRRALECAECSEFAWFRAESRNGHPPHFCSHHAEDCGLKVRYEVVGDALPAGQDEAQIDAGDSIIVRLDLEEARQIDVLTPAAGQNEGQGRDGVRHVGVGGRQLANQHFSLRRILYRLVQSPGFRQARSRITLYRNENEVLIDGPADEVVCSFDQLTKEKNHDKLMLYWGAIASAGRTPDGKLWLNASLVRGGVSVAIYEDIAQQFLDAFEIEDLEDLAGAHVLLAGRCLYADSGKPVIRCGAVRYIVVRRYRDVI